ncbi:Gfo/Idh/MocA family protein [Hyphomonas sp.]|uniref:Gfo/Idh/MocA family protein n=1 Tax=Hyphomonas sp. TaxID=87 RepID=UPI003919FB38
MIRIGILGAAKIAPKAVIVPASKRADCSVVCVAARDGEKARAYAGEHGIPEWEASYEALIARRDIDLIYNALPPHRHMDLTIAALEAGKAVLCEKPFAMNAREARAMTEAAARSGRPLVEAFHYRFHPMFEEILRQVNEGAIGKLCAVRAEFSVAIKYRPGELRHDPALGGGALMDLGCYALHWARTVAGSEPEVKSASARLSEHGADLVTEANLEFPGGVPAKVRTSMMPGQRFKALLALQGTEGVLVARNPLHPSLGSSITIRRGLSIRRYSVEGQTTYDHQLAHMIDVMKTNAPPLTGGADAVANMALIDAVYAAAGVNRPA